MKDAWFNLGLAYYNKEMHKEALKTCDNCLKFAPRFRKAIDLREKIQSKLK